MFGNAKQSIPERFIKKMEVDKKIKEFVSDNVIQISDIRDTFKPMLAEQAALRHSCNQFIMDQKTRGPQNNA